MATCTLSSSAVGNRSSGTTFLSGSVVGTTEPPSVVLLYRSPRPRTNTNELSTTDSPVTRCIAAAASESPLARISCEPTLSVMTDAFLRCVNCAAAVDDSASTTWPVTVTSSANLFIASGTSTVRARVAASASTLTVRSR